MDSNFLAYKEVFINPFEDNLSALHDNIFSASHKKL